MSRQRYRVPRPRKGRGQSVAATARRRSRPTVDELRFPQNLLLSMVARRQEPGPSARRFSFGSGIHRQHVAGARHRPATRNGYSHSDRRRMGSIGPTKRDGESCSCSFGGLWRTTSRLVGFRFSQFFAARNDLPIEFNFQPDERVYLFTAILVLSTAGRRASHWPATCYSTSS
jgi:hypothetical protein